MDPAEKRRNEIEAKKAKLAELRRLRGERQSNFPLSRAVSGIGESLPSPRLADRKDIDELVNSLVGDSSASRRPRTDSRVSSKGGAKSHDAIHESSSSPRSGNLQSDIESDRPSTVEDRSVEGRTTVNVKPPEAVIRDSASVIAESKAHSPAPVIAVVTYSKGTQTQNDHCGDDLDKDVQSESQEELVARLRKELQAELQAKETEAPEDSKTDVKDQTVPSSQITTLSEDERARLLQSDESSAFLDRSSKGIERALDDPDVLVDYTRDSDAEPAESSDGKLRQIAQFAQETTKRRMITSVDWSPQYQELTLASYTKHQTNMNEVQGLVLVWNIRLPHRPEFTFQCESEVQIAIFSPHHANYIIGGSYSGQILLWDTRSPGRPVLQSPLTGKGHTYPITGLNVIGTKQAHSIVSTSSDGTVCTWSLDMLAQPQEMVELVLLPPSKVEEVAPTAVSHTTTDTSTFLIGTEDGNVYSVNRLDRAGAKAGIDPKVIYAGHAAMITGLKHHPSKGPMDLGDLFISSSLDWTVRLWRLKTQASYTATTNGASAAVQKHLLEFQKDDMVYDVQWSPTRPGVFASVDGTGECHVYDLCQSHEIPLAKGSPISATDSVSSPIPRALNKVVWDHEDGKRLAVAGIDGLLTIFEVPDSLGGKESNADQWYNLNGRLKTLATAR